MTSVDWCSPEASRSLCLTSARSLEGYSLGEMNPGEARTRWEAKGQQREFQRGCGVEELSTQAGQRRWSEDSHHLQPRGGSPGVQAS